MTCPNALLDVTCMSSASKNNVIHDEGVLKVGIIGAGNNTRAMHIPGFRAISQVIVSAVANSTPESSERAAKELGIPVAYDNWRDLIDDETIDAVCIGTLPNMHEVLTVAALEADKHVLCEARMAAHLDEALSMYSMSLNCPHLVAQLVPAPFSLKVDAQITELLTQGVLGELQHVDIVALAPAEGVPAWRKQSRYSGKNTLTLGIWYEMLMRWVGTAKNVTAVGRVSQGRQQNAGQTYLADIPDQLQLMGELHSGPTYAMRFSSVAPFAHNEVTFTGTKGVLKFSNHNLILRTQESTQEQVIIPAGAGWQVEADFVASIRTGKPVQLTHFYDGIRYMAFTEAVHTSVARRDTQGVEY